MDNIILYKDFDKSNYEIITNLDWGRKNNKNFSQLHGLSSYLAMFAPALPHYFIDLYTKEGDLVMDNFSGRGTTALVCREMNRKFIGTDLNPYAYVLSRLKVSTIKKDKILLRLKQIEKKYYFYNYDQLNINKDEFNEMKIFYADNTLKQLCFIRDCLGKKWKKINEIDNAILVFCLSIMHGPMKKNNNTIYLSLSMPNSMSMSPNYVRNFSIKKNLTKPEINVFEQIRNRIETKFDEVLEKEFDGKILYSDATVNNRKIKDNSVSLVITSPPYLNIVNYTNSNWLKLWLLGFGRKNISKEIKLSDKHNFEQYISFIKKYLNNIWQKLKKGGHVCLVVGDVFDNPLIDQVWTKIKDDVNYEFVGLYIDNKYSQNRKITNMLNKKSGKATRVEKVLILRKKYE